MGFRAWGLGFRLTFCCFCGFGFGFQGFWFGFWALGLLVWSLGLRSLNIGVPSGTLEVLPMDKILHDFMEIMVAQFQGFRYVRSCRILSIKYVIRDYVGFALDIELPWDGLSRDHVKTGRARTH